MAGGQGPPPTECLVGKDGGHLAGESERANVMLASGVLQSSGPMSGSPGNPHGPSKGHAHGASEARSRGKRDPGPAPAPSIDSGLTRTLSASKLSALARVFVPQGVSKPQMPVMVMPPQQILPLQTFAIPPPAMLTVDRSLVPIQGPLTAQPVPLPPGILPVVSGMYMQQPQAQPIRQGRKQHASSSPTQAPVTAMASDPVTESPTELDTPGAASANEAAIDPAEEEAREELKAKILKQVEFYFSDTNLPTDNYLLEKVKKNAEGYVPVAIVANFRKVKALTKQRAVVQSALKNSELLVLSDDGKMVRRKEPLVEVDMSELQGRTVVGENLPEDHSIEAMELLFGKVGTVKMVRVCQPTAANGANQMANKYPGTDMLVSNKLHALVEYETVAEAERAVAELTDQNNWRSGLRVRLLVRRSSKFQSSKTPYQQAPPGKTKKQAGPATSAEGTATSAAESAGATAATGDSGVESGNEVDTAPGVSEPEGNASEREGGSAAGSRRKGGGHMRGRGKGRGRGSGGKDIHSSHSPGMVIGSPLQGSSYLATSPGEGMVRLPPPPPPGPKMPDGTRGFTFGRGKKLQEKREEGGLPEMA